MDDFLKLIEDIQSIMFTTKPVDIAKVTELADRYAAACEKVNDQLRHCQNLLVRGERTQAVQASEVEPRLLDQVLTLNFADLPKWTSFLASWQLPAPPPLLLDVAGELHEAQALEKPLDNLFAHYRLLTLARAPLSCRVFVLRLIDRRAPGDRNRADDLRKMEAARLDQMLDEAKQSFENEDLRSLKSVHQELTTSPWEAPIPNNLRQQVDRLHGTLQSRFAVEKMEQAQIDLHNACLESDVVAGREARDQLNKLQKMAYEKDYREVMDLAADDLAWLEQQDAIEERQHRYDEAVSLLDHALATEQPLDRVDICYRDVAAFDEGVPDDLEQRYRERHEAVARARRRRIAYVTVVSAVLLLVAVGATWFTVSTIRFKRAVARHAAELQQRIDDERLDDADQYYRKLEEDAPRIAAHDTVQAQYSRLQQQMAQEETRKEQFQQAFNRVELAGVENPDDASLADARGLAKTDDELLLVNEWEEKISGRRRELTEEQQATYLASLEDIGTRITTLEESESGDEQARADELTAVRGDLDELVADNVGIDPNLLSRADSWHLRLDDIQSSIDEQARVSSALEQITAAVADDAAFQSRLRRYTSDFPDDSRSSDFQKVLDEASLWAGLQKWNALVKKYGWKPQAVTNLAASQAAELELNRLAEEAPGFPQEALLRPLTVQWASMAGRVDEFGDSRVANLRTVFSNELLVNSWMVEMRDGARYYCPARPDMSREYAKSVWIEYVSDFEGATVRKELRKDDILRVSEAPQCALTRQVLAQLGEFGKGRWETAAYRLIDNIVEAEGLDPILQAVLLKKAAETACHGSWAFSQGFSRYVQDLSSPELNLTVPWMDPDNRDATTARKLAKSVLMRLPPPDQLLDTAVKKYNEVTKPTGFVYEWIGWLGKDETGEWQVFRSDAAAPSASGFFSVTRAAGGEGVEFALIARATGNNIAVTSRSAVPLREGRPVFVQRGPEI